METDIYIGGNGFDADRHFAGKIAGLTISSGPLTDRDILSIHCI